MYREKRKNKLHWYRMQLTNPSLRLVDLETPSPGEFSEVMNSHLDTLERIQEETGNQTYRPQLRESGYGEMEETFYFARVSRSTWANAEADKPVQILKAEVILAILNEYRAMQTPPQEALQLADLHLTLSRAKNQPASCAPRKKRAYRRRLAPIAR